MEYTSHYSVLKTECIEYLTQSNTDKKDLHYYADLTFGGGGHTTALAETDDNARVVSFDQDPEALENGRKLISERKLDHKIDLVDSNFEHFATYIKEKRQDILDGGGFDGVMMDLGVSSHHFDKGDRGFSFRFDAPLDMRMDVDNSTLETAEHLVNNLSEYDLADIFWKYGEEKFCKKIARFIIERRENERITTTKQLEAIVKDCYPKKLQYTMKINPATKVFQALRIAVNRELDVLTTVLSELLPLMKVGGRIAVISFHSLEDRIAKNMFKEMEKGEMPCAILTKKPVIPSEKEILENSRSRSAKLRVLERIEKKKSKNKYAKFSKLED